jgi:hypothetical protein
MRLVYFIFGVAEKKLRKKWEDFCGAGNAFSGDYQGHCVLPLNNRYLIRRP